MIGRADIEESKSNVAMNAWLPQASYPCGNFSGTSSLKFRGTKGSIGPHFHGLYSHWKSKSRGLLPFCSTGDFCSPWAPLRTPALSFNRCAAPAKLPTWQCLQPGSASKETLMLERGRWSPAPLNWISKKTIEVVVFHRRRSSHLFYTLYVFSQCQTRVKLNRVFFPRWFCQARSLGCGFAR